MDILHINSYFSTSGLFKQVYDRQVKQGHKLKVYVPISHQFPQERVAASGDYLNLSRNHDQWMRWFFPLKHHKIWQDLKESYSLDSFDLTHAHSLFSNGWLARQVYLKYHVPYIVAVRNADLHTFFEKMPWMRNVGLDILRDAKQIIFISQNTYQQVFNRFIPTKELDNLKGKSQVIANGIDDYWHNNRFNEKKFICHQPLRIVTAGKVSSGKRFVELAKMIEHFSKKYQAAELHIAGPNWDAKILKQLQAMDHITYHGALNKAEMVSLYRSMDLFALLSFPETFGLVYPEAMSQGLPVIYTQNEGFDSFFKNYHVGVSVDRFDQTAFDQAILYILNHYERLSQDALEAINPFKWDEIISRYEKLYQSIIS
ncbi:glycosyltransferase family 4 protein [Facklamia sp. P12945]|uniref:glycosyltransferase family 4 protein n=1 Tax=unclassified Facklamia TaxID=2622293 RepID=UPI003D1803D6